MKTIPVCLFVAALLAPAVSFAQPDGDTQGHPLRDGPGKHGGRRAFLNAWKVADEDGNGSLSMQEFSNLPRMQRIPDVMRVSVFKRLDKNSDGELDREELGKAARPRDGQGPGLQRLWELDVDKNGSVSLEEFKNGRIFSKLTPEKQMAVFRRLDTDGDGVVTPKDKPKFPLKRPRHSGLLQVFEGLRFGASR